jgi:hypothetical protein
MKNTSRLLVSFASILHPSFCFLLLLTTAGVELLHRKAAMKSEPTIGISASVDRYQIKRLVALKSTEDTFRLGQEFEHHRFDDGAKVTCLFNLEDNKLLETRQAPGQVTVTATWAFSYEGLTIESLLAEGVAGTEVYKRL